MCKEMINALKKWLENVMPMVVGVLADTMRDDVLLNMSSQNGIQGPFQVDLKEYGAPVTAIRFYMIFQEDGMLLGTSALFKADGEDVPGRIDFNCFFITSEFTTSIVDDEHVDILVSSVMKQLLDIEDRKS